MRPGSRSDFIRCRCLDAAVLHVFSEIVTSFADVDFDSILDAGIFFDVDVDVDVDIVRDDEA